MTTLSVQSGPNRIIVNNRYYSIIDIFDLLLFRKIQNKVLMSVRESSKISLDFSTTHDILHARYDICTTL